MKIHPWTWREKVRRQEAVKIQPWTWREKMREAVKIQPWTWHEKMRRWEVFPKEAFLRRVEAVHNKEYPVKP